MENATKERRLPKGISKRADGRYQGRFTFQGERFTLYDRDVKALQKKMADAKYEMEHGIYLNAQHMTLNTFFETWLREIKENTVKANTLSVYMEIYKIHISPALGKQQVSSINKLMVQRLLNNMSKNGLSANTLAKTKAILYSIFKEAMENRMISYNPCENITIRRDKTERRVLSFKEQQIFLEAIRGSRYEMLCILGLSTGLRIGELSGLRWSDINFEEKTLTVERTYIYLHDVKNHQMKDEFHSPKTKNSCRTIRLLDSTLSLLAVHKEKQRKEKAVAGETWCPVEGGEDLIFTTKTGGPVRGLNVAETLNNYVKKINKQEEQKAAKEHREPEYFERITPHTLRHTFATRAFESGIPPKVVQQILGHSSLEMTMDLYTHVTEDVQSKEIQKLAIFF
ncbi:MAG: tyrosine-type recombinase/integrase [Lachnospiraceae bacterium]|nr:tyrosine-type recombinase/integrase [Lachnospiraceae bacterium]